MPQMELSSDSVRVVQDPLTFSELHHSTAPTRFSCARSHDVGFLVVLRLLSANPQLQVMSFVVHHYS